MLVAAKVLQAAKYVKQWSNVHEPLKKRTYLGKKKFLIFWVLIFSCPKAITNMKNSMYDGWKMYQKSANLSKPVGLDLIF